jgi:hypothetical protein
MPEPITNEKTPSESAKTDDKKPRSTAIIVALIGALAVIVAALVGRQWNSSEDKLVMAGMVVDASTNKPVRQASITFVGLSESSVTDDSGNFSVFFPSKEVPTKAVRTRIEVAGYRLYDRSHEVPGFSYTLQLTPDSHGTQQSPIDIPPTWHTEDEKGIPYSLTWSVDPACRQAQKIDAQHGCHFVHTQQSFAGDNTPYDQWNLSLEAPGPVYDVTCQPTGSNEFNEIKGNPKGHPDGNVGRCSGWINGGDAEIRMTVLYKMLR